MKMADGSTAIHDLTTKDHLQSLISQNTSLYLCTGVYIKTYINLFIHMKWKFPHIISGNRDIRFPRIELFISEKCLFNILTN